MFRLRWTGDAEHYVIGYPSADIEVEDLDEALRLAESGLYEIIEDEATGPAPAPAAAEGQE